MNFGTSLDDGSVFSALVASLDPTFSHVDNLKLTDLEKMENAFVRAESHLGIPMLVSAADMVGCVDEKSAITYIALMYQRFKDCSSLTHSAAIGLEELVEKGDIHFNFVNDEWKSAKLNVPSTIALSAVDPKTRKSGTFDLSHLDIQLTGEDGSVVPVDVTLEDGVVLCNYVPKVVGKMNVRIMFRDKVKAEGTIEVSTAEIGVHLGGDGLNESRVGERTKFNVQLTEGDSPSSLSPEFLECVLADPNQEDVKIEKDGNGGFSFVPTLKGLHTLQLFYRGELIFKRPIVVKPPRLHFNISGPGLHELQAEVPTEFEVAVMDRDKETPINAAQSVKAAVYGPDGDELENVQERPNSDLSLSFLFTPLVPGPHDIVVEYDEVEILDITVEAQPAPSSRDRHFTLQGPGLEEPRVALKAPFVITMYDKPDGQKMNPDGLLAVSIVDPTGQIIPAYVEEKGSVSNVCYTPVKTGVHVIDVTYKGKLIVQTKVEAKLKTQNLHFDVKGPGLHAAIIGEETFFSVRVTDKASGDALPVLSLIEATLKRGGEENENSKIGLSEDEETKTVTAKYTAEVAGSHAIELLFNGKTLIEKELVAKPKGGMQFSLKGGGLKTAKLNEKSVFQVRILDKASGGTKILMPVGDKLTCHIKDPKEELVSISHSDLPDGTREVSYVPLMSGQYTILIKYGEKKLLDSVLVVSEKGAKKK